MKTIHGICFDRVFLFFRFSYFFLMLNSVCKRRFIPDKRLDYHFFQSWNYFLIYKITNKYVLCNVRIDRHWLILVAFHFKHSKWIFFSYLSCAFKFPEKIYKFPLVPWICSAQWIREISGKLRKLHIITHRRLAISQS